MEYFISDREHWVIQNIFCLLEYYHCLNLTLEELTAQGLHFLFFFYCSSSLLSSIYLLKAEFPLIVCFFPFQSINVMGVTCQTLCLQGAYRDSIIISF